MLIIIPLKSFSNNLFSQKDFSRVARLESLAEHQAVDHIEGGQFENGARIKSRSFFLAYHFVLTGDFRVDVRFHDFPIAEAELFQNADAENAISLELLSESLENQPSNRAQLCMALNYRNLLHERHIKKLISSFTSFLLFKFKFGL